MFAHRIESEVEFVFYFPCNLARNAYSSGLSQRLHARGYIYALAKAILAFDNHFAQIDADAGEDSLLRGDARGALGQAGLQGNRALDSVNYAAKIGEHAIAHQLENSTAVFFDRRLEQFLVMGPQPLKRSRLVALHMRRVSHHVGGEYSGEFSLH